MADKVIEHPKKYHKMENIQLIVTLIFSRKLK